MAVVSIKTSKLPMLSKESGPCSIRNVRKSTKLETQKLITKTFQEIHFNALKNEEKMLKKGLYEP